MPSLSVYHLTWVSLTLDVWYLLTAAAPDLGYGHMVYLYLGYLLTASAPDLGRGVTPLGHHS